MIGETRNPKTSIVYILINIIEHYVCGSIGFGITFVWLLVVAIITKHWQLVLSSIISENIFASNTSCYYYNRSVIR